MAILRMLDAAALKTMRPTHDHVLLRRIVESTTASGLLIIPATAGDSDQVMLAEVLAVGPGRQVKVGPREGERIPVDVAVGDLVMLSRYNGDQIETNGETYVIVTDDAISGVLERDGDTQRVPHFEGVMDGDVAAHLGQTRDPGAIDNRGSWHGGNEEVRQRYEDGSAGPHFKGEGNRVGWTPAVEK